MGVPLSLALNAQLPVQWPQVWQELRAAVPKAPIIAHGLNNSTDLLPLADMAGPQTRYFDTWWARDFITMSAR